MPITRGLAMLLSIDSDRWETIMTRPFIREFCFTCITEVADIVKSRTSAGHHVWKIDLYL